MPPAKDEWQAASQEMMKVLNGVVPSKRQSFTMPGLRRPFRLRVATFRANQLRLRDEATYLAYDPISGCWYVLSIGWLLGVAAHRGTKSQHGVHPAECLSVGRSDLPRPVAVTDLPAALRDAEREFSDPAVVRVLQRLRSASAWARKILDSALAA